MSSRGRSEPSPRRRTARLARCGTGLQDLGLEPLGGQLRGQVAHQGQLVPGRVGGVEAQHLLEAGDGLGAGREGGRHRRLSKRQSSRGDHGAGIEGASRRPARGSAAVLRTSIGSLHATWRNPLSLRSPVEALVLARAPAPAPAATGGRGRARSGGRCARRGPAPGRPRGQGSWCRGTTGRFIRSSAVMRKGTPLSPLKRRARAALARALNSPLQFLVETPRYPSSTARSKESRSPSLSSMIIGLRADTAAIPAACSGIEGDASLQGLLDVGDRLVEGGQVPLEARQQRGEAVELRVLLVAVEGDGTASGGRVPRRAGGRWMRDGRGRPPGRR